MPEYTLILLSLLLVSIFLHWEYKLKIFKSRSHAFTFFTFLFLVGAVWDYIAISRGHWSYGEKFLLGPHFASIPIEDYSFFLVLPYFGLVLWKFIEQSLNS